MTAAHDVTSPAGDNERRDDGGHRPGMSFEALYDAHFDAIFRYVLHRVGSVAEAEDLTAQTFFKALRSFWRFRWIGVSPAAWLFRIATNEIRSYYRRRRREVGYRPEAADAVDARVAEGADAEDALTRNESFDQVTRCLRRLEPDEQALVVLRYLEEKSFREIGEIMRRRTGTVTMRTHRALDKLRRELSRQGIDHARFRSGLEESATA